MGFDGGNPEMSASGDSGCREEREYAVCRTDSPIRPLVSDIRSDDEPKVEPMYYVSADGRR